LAEANQSVQLTSEALRQSEERAHREHEALEELTCKHAQASELLEGAERRYSKNAEIAQEREKAFADIKRQLQVAMQDAYSARDASARNHEELMQAHTDNRSLCAELQETGRSLEEFMRNRDVDVQLEVMAREWRLRALLDQRSPPSASISKAPLPEIPRSVLPSLPDAPIPGQRDTERRRSVSADRAVGSLPDLAEQPQQGLGGADWPPSAGASHDPLVEGSSRLQPVPPCCPHSGRPGDRRPVRRRGSLTARSSTRGGMDADMWVFRNFGSPKSSWAPRKPEVPLPRQLKSVIARSDETYETKEKA